MSRFEGCSESSFLPDSMHSRTKCHRKSVRGKQQRLPRMSNLLFPSVIILIMTIVSRFPFTSAFLSQLSKSSTVQRSGRNARSLLSKGTPTVSYLQRNTRLNNNYDLNDEFAEFTTAAGGGYNRPVVQWYPGHIAKAERQLSETLKAVDVVVEVRDARACKATAHPRVGEWCAGRPRIVVLTHLDMVPKSAAGSWRKAYETLGAERWDEAPINRQVANQAKQAREIRSRFEANDPSVGKKKKKKQSNESKIETKNGNTNNITPVEQVLFVNAKQGTGIHALHRAIFKAGAHVQERRERRGLNPRALRVGIIGYPNVGKSALINKILGRKRAKTENTPGVTRSLQWIRVRTEDSRKAYASGKSAASPTSSTHSNAMKREFELLDSPGIIPAKMVDQSDALLLAACNCIGQAAYDNQAVAAYLCEWLKAIHIMEKQYLTAPEWQKKCKQRYGFDPLQKVKREEFDFIQEEYMTGEDMLFRVADELCRGDAEDAARKILQDFRTGRMGPVALQLAPETEEDGGQLSVPIGDGTVLGKQSNSEGYDEEFEKQAQEERARIAVETAKQRGLELPPIVDGTAEDSEGAVADVGKGMFDGW
jgi:ribosome biogenesis GTPase A